MTLGNVSKGYNVHGAVGFFFLLFIVCVFFLFSPEFAENSASELVAGVLNHPRDAENSTNRILLQPFIAALQEATRRAAGGENESDWFNEEARAKWNRENPCLSRREMPRMYDAVRKDVGSNLKPNPEWELVMQEYARLHRTCMHRVGNPTSYFMSKNTSVDCKFTVVDTVLVGLGNRLLVITSAFMYALMTQRVLLIAGTDVLVPDIVCEPFEGSSWLNFDPQRAATPFYGENQYWNSSQPFHDRIDTAREQNASSTKSSLVMDYAVANGNSSLWVMQPESRFYCDTEQEYYKNVPWVYFTSCRYFLPHFFTVPSFRPALDALFPDRMVLTRLLRDLMAPADTVWTRVKSINRGYFAHTTRRFGIHIRYRYGIDHFTRIHKAVVGRIFQCAIENRMLPPLRIPSNESASPPVTIPNSTTVFVASLYEAVRDNLTETFLRYPTTTGEAVQVVQLSHEADQKYGAEIDQASLAEVITLSLSDYLFVTPMSTFSGMAQAYGGLIPWFINFSDEETVQEPCIRAQTVDVCFQGPYDYNIQCRYDSARNSKTISSIFPDVQRCLVVDVEGIQLITTNVQTTGHK